MNKITKKKFRVKNGQDHSADVLEYFLKGISQATYLGKKVCEFIRELALSVDLSEKESEEIEKMKHIGRIKVVQEAEDIMDYVCVCPHCNNHVRYGEMMMTSGIHNCPKCNEEVNRQIKLDKEADYNVYVRKANGHEYEPYRYMEEK